jgi:hypothetical protein
MKNILRIPGFCFVKERQLSSQKNSLAFFIRTIISLIQWINKMGPFNLCRAGANFIALVGLMIKINNTE